MASRAETYFELSTRLALMDDSKLTALLKGSRGSAGWGTNRTLCIDGKKVFAKSVPLTDREYRNAYSTRNHYQLPTYYNYGVGSAGFGVFREIATHVKTTNWVLSGAIESFPLMYHHRILPVTGKRRVLDAKRLDLYVRYWNGSKRVRRYIEERLSASYEAVVFLEFIPHVLHDRLGRHLDELETVIDGMRRTLAFLRRRGVVHFDAHGGNILTDGRGVFLADYGLVLDSDFDLSAREREFLSRHRHYDSAEFCHTLTAPLRTASQQWAPETAKAIAARHGVTGLVSLLDHAEVLCAEGHLKLERNYLDVLVRCRDVIAEMDRFFSKMHGSSRKNAHYDDVAMHRLLREARMLTDHA